MYTVHCRRGEAWRGVIVLETEDSGRRDDNDIAHGHIMCRTPSAASHSTGQQRSSRHAETFYRILRTRRHRPLHCHWPLPSRSPPYLARPGNAVLIYSYIALDNSPLQGSSSRVYPTGKPTKSGITSHADNCLTCVGSPPPTCSHPPHHTRAAQSTGAIGPAPLSFAYTQSVGHLLSNRRRTLTE